MGKRIVFSEGAARRIRQSVEFTERRARDLSAPPRTRRNTWPPGVYPVEVVAALSGTDCGYEVRRIILSDGSTLFDARDPEVTFDAYALDEGTAYEAGDVGLVVPDGEGGYVFVPFKSRTELFVGVCQIQEDMPNAPHAGQSYMANAVGGAWEERLLVKALSPFGLPRNVQEFAFHVQSFAQDLARDSIGGKLSLHTADLEFRPIIADFEIAGGSCATWTSFDADGDTKVSETGKAAFSSLGDSEVYSFSPDVTKIIKVFGGHGARWGWGKGADGNTLTCYGLEIRATNLPAASGLGSTPTDMTGLDGLPAGFPSYADDFGRMIFW